MPTVIVTVAGSTDPSLNGADVFTLGAKDISLLLEWSKVANKSRIYTLFGTESPTDEQARTAWARAWIDESIAATNRHIQNVNATTAILGSTTITATST